MIVAPCSILFLTSELDREPIGVVSSIDDGFILGADGLCPESFIIIFCWSQYEFGKMIHLCDAIWRQ